ncbi:MAG: hypothetical protein ACYC39_09185, partial [Thiobacillus sp.]
MAGWMDEDSITNGSKPIKLKRGAIGLAAAGCYTPLRNPAQKMFDLKSLFSPEGACATVLPGWRSRPQQLAMAEAVEHAIAGN